MSNLHQANRADVQARSIAIEMRSAIGSVTNLLPIETAFMKGAYWEKEAAGSLERLAIGRKAHLSFAERNATRLASNVPTRRLRKYRRHQSQHGAEFGSGIFCHKSCRAP